MTQVWLFQSFKNISNEIVYLLDISKHKYFHLITRVELFQNQFSLFNFFVVRVNIFFFLLLLHFSVFDKLIMDGQVFEGQLRGVEVKVGY